MMWLYKTSKNTKAADPIFQSKSIRDHVFVNKYSDKFNMKKQEISPLFYDKEFLMKNKDIK
jgi:hypothetical protein